MIVYKFGGASVKDSAGIRNLYKIVLKEKQKLIIVVSAFGKTTNALEKVLKAWFGGDNSYMALLGKVKDYHTVVAEELLGKNSDVSESLEASFSELLGKLTETVPGEYDHDYDMIVSNGEVWSTIIVEGFLRSMRMNTLWKDIRGLLVTDNRYRDANVIWDKSTVRITGAFNFNDAQIYVTQGFIGATPESVTTTLGREGSDYTAAIIANILDAEKVVVWKDVPGIMNADPKWIASAEMLGNISYNEAVEMTFSGAKVIHPKTIKPLHNKKIPMHVRSFIDHDAGGTVISEEPVRGIIKPIYVRKEDQILISVLPRDLSFVMGENLAGVFLLFSDNGVRVNLVQAGAVSIDVCADNDQVKISKVLDELRKDYTILYNDGVEMLTIRHYDKSSYKNITAGMEVLISQTTRNSIRIVARRS